MTEATYYEAADLWHAEKYSTSEEEARLSAAASLLPTDARTVADVGCGQGAFLRWLEAHRPDLRLFGIERSTAAVQSSVCKTSIMLGSIETLPFDNHGVDAVVVLEVLEHLPHGIFDRGVAELRRVSKRSIVVSVPYREKRHQVRCPQCACRFHPNYHMRSFDEMSVQKLFDGFLMTRCEILPRADYVGGPLLRWGHRFLRGGTDNMPPGSLCPQCGYRQGMTSSLRRRAASKIRHRLPIRMRPNWMVVRFDRASTAPGR